MCVGFYKYYTISQMRTTLFTFASIFANWMKGNVEGWRRNVNFINLFGIKSKKKNINFTKLLIDNKRLKKVKVTT